MGRISAGAFDQDFIEVEELRIKQRRALDKPVSSAAFDPDTIEVEELRIKRIGALDNNNEDPLSLGERIQKGQSLLTLANLVTQEEIDYLVESSKKSAAEACMKRTTGTDYLLLDRGLKGRVCIRMPTAAAAQRENLTAEDVDILPEAISQCLEQVILERALRFVDQRLCPSIKETLFGSADKDANNAETPLSITELFLSNQLNYSDREPAVNIYTAPNGHFSLHKDNQALTIVVPLSNPDDDFTGGGTAFWKESFPLEGQHDPALVMKPKAGTALLFGGKVSHKGLHVKTGTRVVFVASFSPLGFGAPSNAY